LSTAEKRRGMGRGGRKGRKKCTFLQQHHAGKAIVEIPKIHTADPALVVQLPIHVEGFVRAHLHLPHSLARHGALTSALIAIGANTALGWVVERGLELPGPGRAVGVAVAVVVAEQVVTAGIAAAPDRQRLVDGGEEVFGEVGDELDERFEVGAGVFGIEAAEEVAGERV
jgi:hypothetical protein